MKLYTGETITTVFESDRVVLTFAPSQFREMAPETIDYLLTPTYRSPAGHYQASSTREKLEVVYELPKDYSMLATVLKEAPIFQRLTLARQALFLLDFEATQLVPAIHPDNFIVTAGRLQMLHRGIRHTLAPEEISNDELLSETKRFICWLLNPKLVFDHLVVPALPVKDQFTRQVLDAEDGHILKQLVERQFSVFWHDDQKTKYKVKKRHYRFLKWGFGVTAVAFLASSGILGWQMTQTNARNQRVIDSQAAYINKNYTKAVNYLEKDDPKRLSKSTQYMLADSYLMNSQLDEAQKAAVKKNLSVDSASNNLLYWIYSGRGQCDTALDIAQNIGDDQLILHAYYKIRDQVESDNNMNGDDKQKKLSKYKEEIEKYSKKVDGTENDHKK